MRMRRSTSVTVLMLWLLAIGAVASAQITTGTIFGTVKDAQGAAIPGATVVVVSDTRGTRTAPVVTNATGEYSVPNVTADTYTVEVSMDGFKTVARKGIPVSGGDRVSLQPVVLEVGGRTEVVNVTAESALIQAQSGERSAVVDTTQIQNLPVSSRNFTAVLANIPGITGTSRLSGGGQNNIMMDGISAMDTGNNGQMLQMNMDAIQEVKVLTQGYQAEYGRSSGLQISAVTKSGSNRFHGSFYEIRTNSNWNSVSWANQKNGVTPGVTKNATRGYTIGGPVGKPGGNNKLFFFYSHEYRPSTSGGTTQRFKLPTNLELAGDFSQSVDNNGNPISQLYNAATGLPKTSCTGTVAAPLISTACFPGNKIPLANRSPIGFAVLNQWKLATGIEPNGISGAGYNYETLTPIFKQLTQQPAVRGDYQLNSSLRVTGKFAGQTVTVQTAPGSIPGFNDTIQKYPGIFNYSTTVNYTINPTTFFEGTWGEIYNTLGSPPNSQFSNRANLGLGNFPLIFPNAGLMDPRYYERKVLVGINTPFFDQSTNMMSLPPTASWSNVGTTPPNITYPGFLNINRTNDVSLSLTKVMGRHTAKAGFYLNHSYKAQNTGAGGGASSGFQGAVTWGNDSNSPIDIGYGYADAYAGIYSSYTQSSRFVEGSFLYNNVDWYLQDNWRVNNRLTLDYGLRFVHQQPQYDQYLQSSNFFLDKWSAAAAPQLYIAGCSTAQAAGAACSSANRQAKNPLTGALLGPNTSGFIGTIVPNSGDLANGIIKAGDPGNSKYNYVWPAVVYAPRMGAAYDLTGAQKVVIRGSYGLFFDRPDGNSVFSQVGNPPFTKNPVYRYNNIDNKLGIGSDAIQSMVVFQYNNPIQKSSQWNAGVQMALPWSSSLDVSYVGQHSFDRLQTVDNNAIDFGAAFLPANLDPTLTSATAAPGSNVIVETLRPYRGVGAITRNTGFAWNTFHSIESSFNRRFRRGVQFGLNYTYTISNIANIGQRLEHLSDGTFRVRADQAQAQALLGDTGPTKHIVRGNFVWDLPDYKKSGTANQVVGAVINDWQLSGVWTGSSGAPYDPGFSYNSNGANINLTGSSNYGARPILVPGTSLGSGCTSNQYSQFNNSVASVAGGLVPVAIRSPTGPASMSAAIASYYGVAASDGPSLGLESGNNLLRGCKSNIVDLTLQRNFRLGGGRQFSVRLDAFNAFNTIVFNGRSSSMSMTSPTSPTIRVANGGSQFLADGSLDPARIQPQNAGWGAVTGASTLRNLQVQARFQF